MHHYQELAEVLADNPATAMVRFFNRVVFSCRSLDYVASLSKDGVSRWGRLTSSAIRSLILVGWVRSEATPPTIPEQASGGGIGAYKTRSHGW